MFDAARVLVIDDSMAVRRLVQLALVGHQVTGEASGQSGLIVVRGEPFDLIIVSDTLPDTTVAAFCTVLTEDERWKRVPVVLLTARAPEETLTAYRGHPQIVEAVRKPFTRDILAEVVHRVLAEPGPQPAEAGPELFLTPEQINAAARALFVSLREGLNQIPTWVSRLDNQQPAIFFAQQLLTEQTVSRVLRHLIPLFPQHRIASHHTRPVAVWANHKQVTQPLADWLFRRHGLPVLPLIEEPDRVSAVARQRPHLILVDLDSAGGDTSALEFARAVRTLPDLSRTNLVLLSRPRTNLPNPTDLGYQDILVKPVQLRALEAWLPSQTADPAVDRNTVNP
jgi:CheY-like chemotaxis protein